MDVVSAPEKLELEKLSFRALQPGTQLTQSEGFIPFELEESYEIGAGNFAFRIRIDTLKADPTLLKERIKELIKHVADTISFFHLIIQTNLPDRNMDTNLLLKKHYHE